jgi:DNA-binding MarR family transcriptional regulator
MSHVEEIRSFNRFYTRRIGLLEEGLADSPFSLVEARVLYELARGDLSTAADLCRSLDMDKAHLSRVLARLRAKDLVAAEISPHHAKHRLLSLTAAGRKAFAGLEQGAKAQMNALLSPLDTSASERLTGAMKMIRAILDEPIATLDRNFILRPPRVGDLGWVIHRQAALYHQEYGWDWTFEALIAGILRDFVENFDKRSRLDRRASWRDRRLDLSSQGR